MIRTLGLAAAIALTMGATEANAGVQGSVFEGSVIRIPTFGTTQPTEEGGGGGLQFFSLLADFGDDFNLFREEFDGVERFGSYDEDDNGFFSIWEVEYATENDYEAFGFSLFGIITTYNINEIGGNDDYFGILYRTGPSELIDLRPAAAD